MREETYTYYFPNSEGEVRHGPLQGEGRAWVPGEYRHPDYPSPLMVRVGEAGVKVWMLSQWLDITHSNEDELRRRYGVNLTHRDIEAARWFREQFREMIDERIREESRAISG